MEIDFESVPALVLSLGFGSLYLGAAHDAPVFNFHAICEAPFEVFFLGKRSLEHFVGFQIHKLNCGRKQSQNLSASLLDKGHLDLRICGFHETSFDSVKNAYGDNSCLSCTMLAWLRFGIIYYPAWFVVNHDVAADFYGS